MASYLRIVTPFDLCQSFERSIYEARLGECRQKSAIGTRKVTKNGLNDVGTIAPFPADEYVAPPAKSLTFQHSNPQD
jgi:hypothetical protein